jgi:hypothetical protein
VQDAAGLDAGQDSHAAQRLTLSGQRSTRNFKISTPLKARRKFRAMFAKAAFALAALGFLLPAMVFAQKEQAEPAHFKRFPATITNDGAYVLAWGLQDDPDGEPKSKTEIPADGEEKIDIDDVGFDTTESIEDYLVDTKTGKIVATIPDFSYYAGSEGRENHFGLEVGWSPDNHGGIAIYQGRYSSGPIAWINPADHKALNVSPQIQKAITRASVQKFGKKAADYEISISSPVFLTPRRVVFNVTVGELSSKRENAEYHSCDVVFDAKGNLDAPQLEFVRAKWLAAESESAPSQDENEETKLNRVYKKLAASLSPHERDVLKQEQLKWLATREHMTAAEKDDQESIQSEFTRRRITELQTRASFR